MRAVQSHSNNLYNYFDISDDNSCIGRTDAIYASPTNCSQSFNCDNNRRVLRSPCNDGLIFDPTKFVCNTDINVLCHHP